MPATSRSDPSSISRPRPFALRLGRPCAAMLAGLAAVAFVAACRTDPTPLKVGTSDWTGYEPLYLARSLGYYAPETIRLVEFSSAAEVARAYRNGLIDVAALTLDEALNASQGFTEQRIVLVCDVSNGADVLLARPEIPSLEALRGRRVGVETTVLGAYVLARALERAGLATSEVEVVAVPLARHERSYVSGAVDAVVTSEPHRSTLLAGGAVTLFDSSQIPGEIADVLLTRDEPAHSDALTALVDGWFRALDHLHAQPEDAAARVAPREQVTPQQFLASLAGIEFPDRPANRRLLGTGPDNLSPTLAGVTQVMLRNGFLAKPPDPPRLDDRFVRPDDRFGLGAAR